MSVVLFLLPLAVHAQAPLELAQLHGGVDLQGSVALLRDPTNKLTLADVRARAASFTVHDGAPLSFGLDYAALWLRFSVHHAGAQQRKWLLEVAEPTLDHVDLYVVHADGRVEHVAAGDALPFASRAVSHANFVFDLDSPPADDAVCYVRVQSDDMLRVPLRAWHPYAYVAHHDRDLLLHAWCLGALLLVALYHCGVFCLVRQVENVWYALVALSLGAVLMALGGYIPQLFLPNHPQLANRMLGLSIALAMLNVAFFTHAATAQLKTLPALSRILWLTALSTLGLVVLAALAPTGLVLRTLLTILLLICVSGPWLLHLVRKFPIPELGLYSVGWYALITSIPVAVLRYAGLFPDSALTEWALPAGFVGYGVANSVALAALASRLRRELATMNVRLVDNVLELQQALAQAEEANQAARRATRAKDEFVATMSHELRTPLNMIINIPQGLVEEFESVRSAHCQHCEARFLLDVTDRIDADTACESCGQRGTLFEGTRVKYQGDEARCLRLLQKIERSGQHLLQMVNGVLDFSKLEAGRFQLELAPVDLDSVLHEVADQMSDIAQRKNIQLEVSASTHTGTQVHADALRIKQVLINLVANAIKFSESETTVAIRWRSSPDSELIEIEDRGIGIEPSNFERIFTSFEQVHKGNTRKYGGTGLGLSISRSLVRMHGGELSVRSELGKGSTFTVCLPRLPADTRVQSNNGRAA